MSSVTKKTHQKRLVTRQTVSLSSQDEKMLKRTFDYMAGYVQRTHLEAALDQKKQLLNELNDLVKIDNSHSSEKVHSKPASQSSSSSSSSSSHDMRSEADKRLDEFYKVKDEISVLEKTYKEHLGAVHTIGIKDIDAITKRRGVSLTKKQIEQMIWEIDERFDGIICYDEFTLAYCRNVFDSTGYEPSSLFHLMEFLIFDESEKVILIFSNKRSTCFRFLFY